MNSEDIKIRLNLGVLGFQHGNKYPPNIEVLTPFEQSNSTEIDAFIQKFWDKLEEKDQKIDRLQDHNSALQAQNSEMSANLKYLQKSYDDLQTKLEETQKRKKLFGIF